jgi:hypothetical protein
LSRHLQKKLAAANTFEEKKSFVKRLCIVLGKSFRQKWPLGSYFPVFIEGAIDVDPVDLM